MLLSGRLLKSIWQKTKRVGELRNDCHGHTDEHEVGGGNSIRACASNDRRLFYHGDDFVKMASENDLQCFAKELNEALIVKVRGVLGGDEGDLRELTSLNRFVR